MRVAVVAWGGTGDISPLAALGAGLQKAGHAVTLAAPASWQGFAGKAGMGYAPISVDPEAVISTSAMRASVQAGGGMAAFRAITRTMPGYIRQWMEEAGVAARGADLLLSGFLPGFFVGHSVAEAIGAQFIPCLVTPFTPTRELPSMAWFPGTNLGGFLNRLSYPAFLHMMWLPFRDAVNRARRECAGLAEIHKNLFYHHLVTGEPALYGFSRHVVPHPEDWSESQRVTGYWFPEIQRDWTPPASLVQFLEAGPPPVYFGFGSMSATNPEGALRIAADALTQSGCRGVLLTGWGGSARASLPSTIWCGDYVPHAWLLPYCAAVIHHGGAGTTGAAFRAGRPQIVIPHNFDQFFWARRVQVLGTGPKPLPRSKLTVERLARAIQSAVEDRTMQDTANALAVKIRAEDGVQEVVKYLESSFG